MAREGRESVGTGNGIISARAKGGISIPIEEKIGRVD